MIRSPHGTIRNGMPPTGTIFAGGPGRARNAGLPCMASFQKIRVPWGKSADFRNSLTIPICYQGISDLHTGCNSLKTKKFSPGKYAKIALGFSLAGAAASGESRPHPPLESSFATSRLRVPPFAPLNLACPWRCWYFGRPFRHCANSLRRPASRSPTPAQGSMT